MNILTVIFLSLFATIAFADDVLITADPSTQVEINPIDKVITDGRIENNIENIYSEIKSGKFERANLLFLGAKRGYSNACLYAGYMFDNGIGVTKNSDKAFLWFQSCFAKHPIAAYNLGVLYAEGRGTTKNMEQAVKYMKASWPALRTLVPQISIRLAYYYYQQKKWAEAWDWAEKASIISNNKKHGDYLMAKLIASGNSPQHEDISLALSKADNAMHSYNPKAAELTAWIYGSGKTSDTTDHAMEVACAYDNIANLMGGAFASAHYCGQLSEEAKHRAEDFAKKWMLDQKKPTPMNFTTTLDGREQQFKG